jgi:hypothetical protein
MFRSRFMPCRDCGASVDRGDPSSHVCDPDRLVDFHLFALRTDVRRLEESFTAYLDSPTGHYEVWRARRAVRRDAS